MGPEVQGILIGIGGTVGSAAIVGAFAAATAKARKPALHETRIGVLEKRSDRFEIVLRAVLTGIIALQEAMTEVLRQQKQRCEECPGNTEGNTDGIDGMVAKLDESKSNLNKTLIA